jgi:hypothetical protein
MNNNLRPPMPGYATPAGKRGKGQMNAERQTHTPVGRVSPQGVTRQAVDADANANVWLRYANPTYQAEMQHVQKKPNIYARSLSHV